jgi:asparagine synthase (glutamine-hydrolysing)
MLPGWFRQKIIGALIKRIPESFGYKSIAQKASWINEMSFFLGGERYAESLSTLRFTQDAKERLFTDEARARLRDYNSREKILEFFDADNTDHVIDKMLYTDLMTRMPDHLLTLVDRMTMAHSIECRSPLMDYAVVEYAAKIPANLKLNKANLKYILKKVASRYLPKELICRQKQGFTFPLGIWMRKELAGLLHGLFRESRFIELGLFNAKYVDTVLEEHLLGKVDHNYRLWILMNLEIWYRLYFENESIDSLSEIINGLRKEN